MAKITFMGAGSTVFTKAQAISGEICLCGGSVRRQSHIKI